MAEKSLNQIPRPLREQYEKGKSAFDRQNFDYAVAIFTAVLDQEPAFWDCRQALRASQSKKAGGGGFFKKMMSGASSSPLVAKGQIALRVKPLEALKIAEQILNGDPNSSQGHKLLADAALEAGLPKTAIMSLEILARISPKDEEIQKELGRAYIEGGQAERGEKIFAELVRLHPGDGRLIDELKDISARKTLAEGGYDALSEGTGSYRDILKNKQEAVALEQEQRQVKSDDIIERQIKESEARLVSEPNNLKLLRTLGELYTQKKDFDRALEAYNKIISSEGAADPAMEKAISDLTVKKVDYAVSQLDPQAPDYAEKSAKLKAERDEFLLADCKKRAERYPNDLQIRFDLGVLCFNAGKTSEAISEFQKAQNNPHRRIQSLSYLGQCFARRKMNDMAARSLQTALKEKIVFDEEKKEIIYALGSVLENMGKKEEAIDQFKQIYEVDVGFKDVAAKVDAHYAGQ